MPQPDNRQARRATLERQKTRLVAIQTRLDALDRRYSLGRLVSFLAGLAALTLVFFTQPGWLVFGLPALCFAIFICIVFLHRRLDHGRLRFRLAASYVDTQLARMTLAWEDLPAPFPLQVDPDHPFAADLNIVGDRSLHHLIDNATSLGGSRRLAEWLLTPIPDPQAIPERHAAIRELTALAGFRGRLAIHGLLVNAEAKALWDGDKLMQALAEPATKRSLGPLLTILSTLAVTNIVLFILNLSGILPPLWIASFGLYTLIYLGNSSAYANLFNDTYTLGKSLGQLRSILVFLESGAYQDSPQLARLCAPFTRADQRPSRFFRRFVWIDLAASLGNNPVLAVVLNALLPWNLIVASLLNSFRQSLRGSLRVWLDAWYELEALCSLANFAWLNPGYTYPTILTGEGDLYRARDLGHPLIPVERRVCNDYAIERQGSVAIITGSNMSGKSTFLRTVGINLCLANAGSPVAAAQMETRLFRLFTCIQVSDSLADGISYFYAEVRRLKQLLLELEKPSPYPVFFLIDEIYRGTNNRERRIGSQAFIHTLGQSQGIGLVSTHDLDLVQLSNLDHAVINYHFREEIRGGRMVYDYRLRPGPCPTTNALKIMEIEGLPVES